MEATAIAKNIRITPQKVKLVVDEIKKMPPEEAISVLDIVPKKAAPIIKKAILSAIANAKNNQDLVESSLKFNKLLIGKGTTFHRAREHSRGRYRRFKRINTNLTIVLDGDKKQSTKPAQDLEKTKSSKEEKQEKEEKDGSKS